MDLESALTGMKDAGCTEEEIRKARRKVDCLDYLIRQAAKAKTAH